MRKISILIIVVLLLTACGNTGSNQKVNVDEGYWYDVMYNYISTPGENVNTEFCAKSELQSMLLSTSEFKSQVNKAYQILESRYNEADLQWLYSDEEVRVLLSEESKKQRKEDFYKNNLSVTKGTNKSTGDTDVFFFFSGVGIKTLLVYSFDMNGVIVSVEIW